MASVSSQHQKRGVFHRGDRYYHNRKKGEFGSTMLTDFIKKRIYKLRPGLGIIRSVYTSQPIAYILYTDEKNELDKEEEYIIGALQRVNIVLDILGEESKLPEIEKISTEYVIDQYPIDGALLGTYGSNGTEFYLQSKFTRTISEKDILLTRAYGPLIYKSIGEETISLQEDYSDQNIEIPFSMTQIFGSKVYVPYILAVMWGLYEMYIKKIPNPFQVAPFYITDNTSKNITDIIVKTLEKWLYVKLGSEVSMLDEGTYIYNYGFDIEKTYQFIRNTPEKDIFFDETRILNEDGAALCLWKCGTQSISYIKPNESMKERPFVPYTVSALALLYGILEEGLNANSDISGYIHIPERWIKYVWNEDAIDDMWKILGKKLIEKERDVTERIRVLLKFVFGSYEVQPLIYVLKHLSKKDIYPNFTYYKTLFTFDHTNKTIQLLWRNKNTKLEISPGRNVRLNRMGLSGIGLTPKNPFIDYNSVRDTFLTGKNVKTIYIDILDMLIYDKGIRYGRTLNIERASYLFDIFIDTWKRYCKEDDEENLIKTLVTFDKEYIYYELTGVKYEELSDIPLKYDDWKEHDNITFTLPYLKDVSNPLDLDIIYNTLIKKIKNKNHTTNTNDNNTLDKKIDVITTLPNNKKKLLCQTNMKTGDIFFLESSWEDDNIYINDNDDDITKYISLKETDTYANVLNKAVSVLRSKNINLRTLLLPQGLDDIYWKTLEYIQPYFGKKINQRYTRLSSIIYDNILKERDEYNEYINNIIPSKTNIYLDLDSIENIWNQIYGIVQKNIQTKESIDDIIEWLKKKSYLSYHKVSYYVMALYKENSDDIYYINSSTYKIIESIETTEVFNIFFKGMYIDEEDFVLSDKFKPDKILLSDIDIKRLMSWSFNNIKNINEHLVLYAINHSSILNKIYSIRFDEYYLVFAYNKRYFKKIVEPMRIFCSRMWFNRSNYTDHIIPPQSFAEDIMKAQNFTKIYNKNNFIDDKIMTLSYFYVFVPPYDSVLVFFPMRDTIDERYISHPILLIRSPASLNKNSLDPSNSEYLWYKYMLETHCPNKKFQGNISRVIDKKNQYVFKVLKTLEQDESNKEDNDFIGPGVLKENTSIETQNKPPKTYIEEYIHTKKEAKIRSLFYIYESICKKNADRSNTFNLNSQNILFTEDMPDKKGTLASELITLRYTDVISYKNMLDDQGMYT